MKKRIGDSVYTLVRLGSGEAEEDVEEEMHSRAGNYSHLHHEAGSCMAPSGGIHPCLVPF